MHFTYECIRFWWIRKHSIPFHSNFDDICNCSEINSNSLCLTLHEHMQAVFCLFEQQSFNWNTRTINLRHISDGQNEWRLTPAPRIAFIQTKSMMESEWTESIGFVAWLCAIIGWCVLNISGSLFCQTLRKSILLPNFPSKCSSGNGMISQSRKLLCIFF